MAVDASVPVVAGVPGEDPGEETRGGAAEQPRQPHLGVVGWLRWAWRQLTSMRTALLLLLLLAVAAVPGSVLPQESVTPAGVEGFREDYPRLAPVVEALGGFDVYASPWFAAVYLLLFTSLVGCVLPRSRQHWRAMRSRPPRTPARLDRLPAHSRTVVDDPADVVLDRAAEALRRRRYRLDRRAAEGAVAAERGYLRETGNLVFHLALVGLLLAVAAGSLQGYRGEVLVTEGDGWSNVVPEYSSLDLGTWVTARDLEPFALDLRDLQVRFEEDPARPQSFGAPLDFAADVVVTGPDGTPREDVLRVNQPLDIDGTRVYLSGNGYAPVVTVRDSTGEVAFSGPVPFLPQDGTYTSTGVVKVLDAQPQGLGLAGLFLPTGVIDPERGPVSLFPDARDPRLVLTAYVGDLGIDEEPSVFVLNRDGMRQLETPDGQPWSSALQPGQTVELPDGQGTVTFDSLVRFAALDVHRDPGKTPALVSAVLALAGLVLSLFVPRRRVWVRARPGAGEDAGRTVVEVGGLARGEDAGLRAEVDAVRQSTAPAAAQPVAPVAAPEARP